MKQLMLGIGLVFSSLLQCEAVRADVRLPAVFGEHMVLQQLEKIRVWGWAESGESVTVTLGGNNATAKAAQGELADIGIGNSTGQTKDWAFTESGATYSSKHLRVFVRAK